MVGVILHSKKHFTTKINLLNLQLAKKYINLRNIKNLQISFNIHLLSLDTIYQFI